MWSCERLPIIDAFPIPHNPVNSPVVAVGFGIGAARASPAVQPASVVPPSTSPRRTEFVAGLAGPIAVAGGARTAGAGWKANGGAVFCEAESAGDAAAS